MSGAKVTGIINANIDEVWKVFRAYGEPVMEWWPIYKDLKIEGDGEDKQGCIRVFNTTTGHFYRESLEQRDDDKKLMVYKLLEIKPSVPTLKTILTTVQFTKKSDTETIVDWSSEIDANSMVLGKVCAVQEDVYKAAIKSLDRYFNPSFGTLQVKIIGAKNLVNKSRFAPNPFVAIDIDSTNPVLSKTKLHTTSPKWNETIKLDVLKKEGQVNISLWDENIFGHDEFLGSATLNLHQLKSNTPLFQKFTLSEADKGEISLAFTLQLKNGEVLEETDDKKEFDSLEEAKSILNELKDQALQTIQELEGGDPITYGYTRYPRMTIYPEVDYENLPRCVDQLHIAQALKPHKIGRVTERITQYAMSQINFLDRSEKSGNMYSALYGEWMNQNDFVIQHYDDDKEFCRQLIQGVNPMMIEACSSIERIPDSLKSLSSDGADVATLIKNKSLYILDYKHLTDIPQYRDMCFYAPIALICQKEGELDILGFQLTRKSDGKDEIFTPSMKQTKPNRYRFARMHLCCADNQYHQFVEHLGFAHLAMEPFAIAYHNCFSDDHPIGKVLKPHFKDTIGINYLARQTLVSPIIPFTDRTFSPGTAGGLRLFLTAHKEWDFSKLSFKKRMESRGFDEKKSDGLKNYFYRDDGFLIWNALSNYFNDIIDECYMSDTDIVSDSIIQQWAEELSSPDKGAVAGFPSEITTKSLLKEILTAIVFNCSAQHSAVNFSQYDYVSYVPNRPDSLFAYMPEDESEITEAFIQKALPDVTVMHFQALFAWLLSIPSETPLSILEGSNNAQFKAIHKKHIAAFKDISESIQARNDQLTNSGAKAYPYLDPQNIAASIDI
ncbi:lipoxygenase family protein [Shewanella sp. HL-SH2]|uniref:lipoxygenase family protein n=1 Tax=Shewanella sp. HL-SH2 TaxID=3436238 RepID=UPI003EB74561